MAEPHNWNPCIADPVRFDCHDCTIGPDVDCKYRTDETLRHERAARLGGAGGLFEDGEECAEEAIRIVRAVLVQQRMALPATALIDLLPRQLASAIPEEQVEVILRRTSGIRETSPGMFKWHGGDGLAAPAGISLDLSTGAAIARMLEEHQPQPPGVRRAKLKRLEALRRLREFARADVAREAITASVDRLSTAVLQRESWRLADAAALATNGSLVAPKWESGSENQAERREFLGGICALNIINEFGAVEACYIELRAELLCTNIRLLASEARKYSRGAFLQYSDVFQAGFEGLDRAIDRYDPYLGYEFSTYATSWVRQSITRTIANEERTIRMPVHAVEALGRMESSAEALSRELGRTPLAAEVADRAGMTVEQVESLSRASQPVSRLSDQMIEEIQDPEDGLGEVEATVASAAIQKILESALTDRERRVIERRFGFGGDEPRTLEEVGQEFGVTRERIRQIQVKALRKLQSSSRERLLALHEPDAQADGGRPRGS